MKPQFCKCKHVASDHMVVFDNYPACWNVDEKGKTCACISFNPMTNLEYMESLYDQM